MQDSDNGEFLNIIVAMAQEKKERLEAIRIQENSTPAGKIVFLLQRYGIPGCAILMLSPLLIRIFFGGSLTLVILFLIFLIVFCIVFYTHLLLDLWNSRIKIKTFLCSPFYDSFKKTIEISLSISNLYLPKLMELSDQSLEIGIIELKNQYHNLEQRTCLTGGAIKNIGLLPSIIALLVMISKMDTNRSWEEITAIIGCANIILFFIAMIADYHSRHWVHAIALTELALKKKQELKQNF